MFYVVLVIKLCLFKLYKILLELFNTIFYEIFLLAEYVYMIYILVKII